MSLNITLDDIRPCLLEDKSVMITLTNYGYISYTRNMLKSLKPFDLDKKIFIIAWIINQHKNYHQMAIMFIV